MNGNTMFSSYKLGNIELKNRFVMAPMTRSRAIGSIPNELMAEYYSQRADAGLIITEGTSPSNNGLGYSRIPGLYNEAHVTGWKIVTNAVHAKGSKIFVQLMHTGRIGHHLNLPNDSEVLAPSAVKAAGQIWTDQSGLQDYPTPKEMNYNDIIQAKKEYAESSKYAIKAGFDGVEIHSANGYLLEQFLSPFSNLRTDEYGGSIENRCRFLLETVDAVIAAIGKEKTGVRLSPYGVASDMKPYPEIDEEYAYLADELNKRGIVYLHVTDHSAMGAPEVPQSIKDTIRAKFKNTLILAGGYTKELAEADVKNGKADLIAFGRPFINNPDLVTRFENGNPIATEFDSDNFYTAGSKGYTDYPAFAA